MSVLICVAPFGTHIFAFRFIKFTYNNNN